MHVAGLLADLGLELDPTAAAPDRPPVRFAHLDDDEQAALAAAEPGYRRILCRCEFVTEGEVREAVHRGAHTLDGVKFRTRVGTGLPGRVLHRPGRLEVLATELDVCPTRPSPSGVGVGWCLERDDVEAGL